MNIDARIRKFDEAAELLPSELRKVAKAVAPADKILAEEIRLRAGRSASIVLPDGEKALPFLVSTGVIASVLEGATESSVHSAKESIKSGFLSTEGGHRIGLCGTAIVKNGELSGFRWISSLAIRISKELKGIAEPYMDALMDMGRPVSTLVVSQPGGGKTTFLRDMIRLCSDRGWRVALADERGEIAAMKNGIPRMDVGSHTDVMELCPRDACVMFLLRTMNSDVIAMDEVTKPADMEALLSVSGCGVRLFATAHCGSLEELRTKPLYARLLENRVFERAVFIRREGGRRVYQIEGRDALC